MPLPEVIRHVPGATFRIRRQFNADLTGFTVTGKVVRGATETAMTTRILDPETAGFVEVEIAATDTSAWDVDAVRRAQITLTLGDEVAITETFYIHVREVL